MISLAQPVIGEREAALVLDVLRTTRLSMGPYVRHLETAFEFRVGRRHAIAVNSGTAALHLAMLAIDLKPGDVVVMPGLSYVATANAVAYCGARPVFCDVDPETWQMDPASCAAALRRWGSAVKAIVAVDLYGGIGPMGEYQELARRHGVPLIVDAAESLGAYFGTSESGNFGEIACFSFFGNKTVTCGEGGMIVTDDDALAARMRLYRGQGQDPHGRRYFHSVIGYNYRLTDLQAAVASAQLEQLDSFVARRRKVLDWYRAMLPGHVILQGTHRACSPSCWMAAVTINPLWNLSSDVDRDAIMAALLEAGIETRPTFMPLHLLPMYNLPIAHLPECERIGRTGICLPTHPQITIEDVGHITRSLQVAIFARSDAARQPGNYDRVTDEPR